MSYLPPGLGPLAAPDGQDRGQRLVHDELARAASGSNRFVAQWAGDFRSKGDGSGVLTVKVGK